MKKFVSILFAAMLIAALCISAFAATGINANEQAVLDKLSVSKAIGANNHEYAVPVEYVNTAKNYFAGDCDMTEAQKDAIIGYIDQGIAILKAQADEQKITTDVYKLRDMNAEARSKVLELGQKACAEVGLDLIYNGSTDQVIITPVGSTTPVFASSPLVKTTGENFVMTTGKLLLLVASVLIACTTGMFVIAKKKGLLVK